MPRGLQFRDLPASQEPAFAAIYTDLLFGSLVGPSYIMVASLDCS